MNDDELRGMLDEKRKEMLDKALTIDDPDAAAIARIGMDTIEALSALKNGEDASIGLGAALLLGTITSQIVTGRLRTAGGALMSMVKVFTATNAENGVTPAIRIAVLMQLIIPLFTSMALLSFELGEDDERTPMDFAEMFVSALAENEDAGDAAWEKAREAWAQIKTVQAADGLISPDDADALRKLFESGTSEVDN